MGYELPKSLEMDGPSVLWHCWLGVRKSIRAVKIWAMRCWCGYLTGERCRLFAYGPANATHTHTHTHPFNGPFLGLPGSAGSRKVKPIWILLKQETVSGSGISWAICKSAPRSRQITMPEPHHSVFYRPYTIPATQPTASKHWRPCNKDYIQP